MHADITSYQLFAYQERSDPPTVNESVWKRVGDVKALPLPMACTLTQVAFNCLKSFNFLKTNSYFFFWKVPWRASLSFRRASIGCTRSPWAVQRAGNYCLVLMWETFFFFSRSKINFRLLLTFIYFACRRIYCPTSRRKNFFLLFTSQFFVLTIQIEDWSI